MRGGAVPDLACRKRLRSCDSAKNKMVQSDGDEKERKKMQNGDSKVKNRKESAVSLDKEEKKMEQKKRKLNSNNMNNKAKTRSDSHVMDERMLNCGNKGKSQKLSSALSEKEKKKKRLNNANGNKKIRTDDDKEEEEKMRNYHSKIKRRKVSTSSFEKGKKRARLHNTSGAKKIQVTKDDNEEEMWNCDSKVRGGKVSATSVQKERKKKRPNNTSREKKVQIDADEKGKKKKTQNGQNKVKSRKASTPSIEKEKKKKKKMVSSGGVVKENKMQPSKSMETKMRSAGKQKKGDVPSDVSKEKKISKEKKTETLNDSCRKRKMEEPPTLFKKVKKMQINDNGKKKVHSGKLKNEKICGCGNNENKKTTLFSFFKVVGDNFEEFLSLPPIMVSKLENLTNHYVYLEDSEGKRSEVKLSVLGGSLAFCHGWNSFVSEHLIKWGDFLLFEYTAKSTFSVRVFGRDSRERLTFNIEGKRKGVWEKQTRSNRSSDDLISLDGNEDKDGEHCISGEYARSKEPETQKKTLKDHVAVDTIEDLKRVECEPGPSVAPDKKDGNVINGQRNTKGISPFPQKTKGISPLRSKKNTIIEILDSASPVDENEGTVTPTASNADSDTHHVTVNTNEYHKKVQSGVGHGPSLLQDDKKGFLPSGQCGTKCISPTCSKEITRILITDAATSTQENDGVKLTTYSHHNEDKHMSIQSEPEATTPANCIELHNLDEDVRGKQGINSIQLESTTAVDKYQNNSKMNLNENACRKYEAPVGFRCLEKWRKGIVSGNAALDGASLMRPESTQKTDSKLVDNYGAIGQNPIRKSLSSGCTSAYVKPIFIVPFQNPSSPDRVSKCEHSGTEINHNSNRQGAAFQLQTKDEQLRPVGGGVCSQRNNSPECANYVAAGNCGAVGLDAVGSEGTFACVESVLTMPVEKHSSLDRISKCGSSQPEIDHHVEVKGTIVQLETNMDMVEPLESTVNSQSDHTPVCTNHVVSCQPEHHFSEQEDRKSTNCVTQVALLPVKDDILEFDDRSSLKINLQFCIPNTTQKWLELPRSLSSAVRQTRQDRNVVMLKDPMKRLWPVFYHENAVFVGFTAGWKDFVAANNLQIGDLCELFKEPDEGEPVYSVQITKS
ncbi:hypothetical protein ACP70R_027327 [Stipagrostis hirtigluma subsp. patula]